MMVIFVSQCEKKALNRTRRVLDAFADRIGDNTWQTVITEEGLQAVKKLLRKTASKNTAVSCRWLRSRSRSDLLWVVGNRAKFNELGVVAVNRTRKNILHSSWENNWHYASAIQIIATLAALLHDIGKTTAGFQHKLQGLLPMGDPYRHEWLSLKLFEFLIQDCRNDEEWLARFTDLAAWLNTQDPAQWLANTNKEKVEVAEFPPLAQWVAWLIMSHHRLPKKNIDKYYQKYFHAFDHWVKNPKADDSSAFWKFDQLVLHSPVWQKQLKRWAGKALREVVLVQLSESSADEQTAISDAFLLYISRMCLMLSDHNYSSLDKFDLRRVKGDANYTQLAANTERATQTIKQALDEHLLGVGAFAARFARVLPVIAMAKSRLCPCPKSARRQ
ncbi:MAG: hypothetical protein CSA51_04335 [Gammaproteobacteria bacterium]|nr:MAG: hypothetical protein CSA51_04335 [Gammaproteobacteria bacterium]